MSRPTKEKKGVLVCGAYGLGNSGDEAILKAVLSQIRETDSSVPITVISRDPRRTAELHKVRSVWSFNVFGLIRAFRRSGLFLSGGGSLIQDVTSRRSLLYYLWTIRQAKRSGCSVVMYGCGIGPVEKKGDRKLAAKVINKCADCVTLRDSRALEELKALGITVEDVRVSGDPALSLPAAEGTDLDRAMRALGIDPEERYIAYSLRDIGGDRLPADMVAAAADECAGKFGCKTVFICNSKEDGAFAERVSELMETPFMIVMEGLRSSVVLGIISRAAALVSGRLHSLIFAASVGTPSVAISYDPKVSGFMEDLGYGRTVTPEELTQEKLAECVEQVLSQDREMLAAQAEELRKQELKNTEVLKEYMEKSGVSVPREERPDGPVKLAFFTSDFKIGGMQKSLVNLLKNLDHERCEADVYYYEDEIFYELPVCKGINYIKLEPKPYWYRFVYFRLLMQFFAKDPAPGKHYDVAIDFNSYQNECALYACTVNADKRVMFVHNDVERKLEEEPKYKILWHFFKGKFAYYDEFAAVSSGIVESFRKASGTDKPIWIVPNYVDTKEIFEKADKPLVFRFDASKYKLCAVGRLCHQKGFDILLDIYARAAELRQDLHLYIIGDGPDREALRLKARDMEIDRRMTFLGNQPNPYAYMSHMDGLAITSRYEGQGMVIMEAKALGLDLYVARNLEGCNQGIRCSDDIAGELLTADKREKQRDDLSAYNRNITRQLNRIFGIR